MDLKAEELCAPRAVRRIEIAPALSSPPKPPTLTVDGSATKLGVERRRVYDVVNILSSLGIVKRLQKNTYENLGMDGVTEVLLALRDDGIRNDRTKDWVAMG